MSVMCSFTYIDAGGMLVAIPCEKQRKREDGPLSRGPKKIEEYRSKTRTRPLDLSRSKREWVFLFRNLM